MKNFIYFISGILFIALISATTVSVMTVKPEVPKETICFTNSYKIATSRINIYSKHGYVVKFISGIYDHSSATEKVIVVMEKY